jgi:cellulose synthase/poly-beta-1,6-N-acetylglucosamine synthase-like glycosyltransferase/peptidoglycan/xylan/chitin deacetylase (PgdA/CDA1 family)
LSPFVGVGRAVWRTGSEEPALWSLFASATAPAFNPQTLETIPALPTVSFQGNGALLRVTDGSDEGSRDVELDGDSIAWARVSTLPSGYQVDRPLLHAGKQLALTFDDGPDATWTPQILAILAKYGIRATFFVVGDQVERFPDIIKAEFAAGHLLGNHTYLHPRLDKISDTRLKWELNATQRLIQALTGHSTTLFRAPYDAHAEPTLPTELYELRQVTQMGYLIAGTDIDSEDYETTADNTPASDQIVRNVVSRLRNGDAHVIVFHDAGGDRSKTVDALNKLIPRLLGEGYQFVGIDDLLDVEQSSVMPPITDLEQFLAFTRSIIVWLRVWGSELLLGLFLVTTALSIARILTLALLISRGKSRADTQQVTGFAPDVRVLIPAHNEAKVIAQTLEAVLKSNYSNLRVTVIDDGSTDDTGRVVEQCAKADSRLSLITQSQCAGKAAALNRGFDEAHEDYVITIDADTVVFPHTVAKLVEPFSDPAVDAVCGNVQVGNVRNTLTKFQHVEYVTSQNYERRAFDTVNCISVVPGATAAWKRLTVLEVGGYSDDTLTEDTDLTLTLLGRGGRIVYAPLAQSVTEAPEKIGALFRQRYRWCLGTLQCVSKHRGRWGRRSLGCITLTNILVFQFLFPVLAPIGDFLLIKCLLRQELISVAIAYLVFLGLDFISPIIAFRLDRQNLNHASVVIIQRFFYRQFMYVVTFAALFGAIRGKRFGWDKLKRTGSSLSPAWSAPLSSSLFPEPALPLRVKGPV